MISPYCTLAALLLPAVQGGSLFALLAIGLACPACLGMVLGRLPCRGAFKQTANCMSLKSLIWFLPIYVILLRSVCLAYDAHMPSDVLHIQCHALVTNGLFLSAVLRSLGAFASLMPYSVFKCADFPWNLLFFGSLECATCTHKADCCLSQDVRE